MDKKEIKKTDSKIEKVEKKKETRVVKKKIMYRSNDVAISFAIICDAVIFFCV